MNKNDIKYFASDFLYGRKVNFKGGEVSVGEVTFGRGEVKCERLKGKW